MKVACAGRRRAHTSLRACVCAVDLSATLPRIHWLSAQSPSQAIRLCHQSVQPLLRRAINTKPPTRTHLLACTCSRAPTQPTRAQRQSSIVPLARDKVLCSALSSGSAPAVAWGIIKALRRTRACTPTRTRAQDRAPELQLRSPGGCCYL